ncbi:phytochelatin synthase family protein [Mesorhizobium sp.]|uniref:phytochelatin synthase family protein n=1 Tax=Mesorhizobium sp. TaxID=1871066 RepID=UPI000FE4A057|nr:phytochelatin synthase family protein [Mesorhizobium sp.]RWA61093.1 MAG: phytochelatin synthase [Mesorhizobium sp.]RWF31200.1 MAG: phytochelatin synthase [Mesorhizobium sp.]TIX17559.1 MAG: phytochelatin synthase [Mesorhizobium sp.]TJW06299.1 MAG: phytochelatin synthase [Mesorhizobium sp.]
MKRGLAFALIAGIAGVGLLGGGALLTIGQSAVSQDAIQSSVIRTPALIDSAWKLPVAASFKADLDWQSNSSRCGPASVANTFRSIGEEETTEAEVLEGTGKCWTGFCIIGLTLDEVAEVARTKTSRKVSVLRNLSAEEFREHLKRANDPNRRYIINFTREKIFGAGSGHFSPIGGYLEAEDMVFVLDVNERYKPWLVERERLFSAMDTVDSDGDKKRGLLLIE